ncbi:MAG: hypothetical protein A3H45_06970 [Ignavibacteria bacterium RIFCSPLOWO2_02_FULL_55_14]|nr:MAG: hypothetical protein A3H45_06970 [Ignavibacteria bacterium RIFCSPLOWO2_02_FULL_55_14]
MNAMLALEFQYRIFISLGIVLAACLCAYVLTDAKQTVFELLLGAAAPRSFGFLIAAIGCAVASLLRMSAGTVLRSHRVMSFEVRPEELRIAPPYDLVRNPIYLADLIAAAAFALCMPLPGVAYPVLLALHYRNLILFEEKMLAQDHGDGYEAYRSTVPRMVPTWRSFRNFCGNSHTLHIDRDGFRFNALYVLFVPGLIVASATGQFFHAVLVGLPAVADWAAWHTKKGLHPHATSEARS